MAKKGAIFRLVCQVEDDPILPGEAQERAIDGAEVERALCGSQAVEYRRR